MNYKNLMIGDWVLCDGTTLKLNAGHIYNLACDSKWANTYTLEPIQISKDILKLNGGHIFWEKWDSDEDVITDEHHFSFAKDLHFGRVYNIDNDNHHEVMMPFKYVHELQHALRLCGLDDLAENFKLKA